MAENIVAAYAGGELGPEIPRTGKTREIVSLTGTASAAGDTAAAYKCRHVRRNARVLGGAFYVSSETADVAGATIVITSRIALASATVHVEIEGDY
jgi:hypothetical protein